MTEKQIDDRVFVLDDINFDPSVEGFLKRARLKPGTSSADEAASLLVEATSIATPKALYKLAYIDEKEREAVVVDGVRLESRVLRVNLEIAHRVFVYIVTCGMELQRWGESLDDMLHQYWADTIKEMALRTAMRVFNEHLNTCYDLGRTSAMSPGSLADWPIRQQRPLFRILGDPQDAIGVELTESFLMIPNKTVSGIRFPTEERFESCQLCPRESCPGRRAAYEPDLYERKYRSSAQANPDPS